MDALWQWRAEASQTLRSLQASKAKLVWRFSGEAQEFPRPESVAEERVRSVERSRGYALPEHRVRALFTLEQTANNAVAPSLPEGVSVNDFRLTPVNGARDCRLVGVCYEWQGRLPSAWRLRWLARWRGTITHPRSSDAPCNGGSCTLR